MKRILLGALFSAVWVCMYGLGNAWTPLPIADDPLFRMPGTQPVEQNAILQAPGEAEESGCLNCHGEDPIDAQGNVIAPGFFWQGSMMAQAARDPVFWATMVVAMQDSIWLLGNPNAADLCLRCHFPGGWMGGRSGHANPGDINASQMRGEDFDGVQCDFCHRMWDPHFVTTHSGAREGSDWLGYWDEAEQTIPGSQARADITFDEDAGQASSHLLFNGASYFIGNLPPAGYAENAGGQFFVTDDNIVGTFELEAKKRASFADTESDHSDLYSRYHKSKFFCSTCHDVSNPALANMGQDPLKPLPTETSPAYSYGHVERTFSEFMLSAYARPGGAPTNPEFQDQGARTITWAAKCQDCHMDDIVGKGCREIAAPLRPDESLEHPNSGAPLHNLQGGNAWITYILGTIDDHFPEFDQVNFDLLNQGPAALTLDLNQGIDVRDHSGSLFLAADRALLQLQLAATIKNLSYDPGTGDVSFRVQNNTAHKLLSGYPEGRRMFVNIKAYDALDTLLHEVNPYGYTINPTGTGGTLKGLDLAVPGISPALNVPKETHRDDLVYEVKPKSDLTGENKTFHFVLATDRYKDNRIPPKGFDISGAPARLVEPKVAAAAAPDYFTAAEYLGGYDDVSLTGVLPAGADRVEVTLYYQGTSREYIQFLRDEINGTASTLTETGAGGDAPYLVQNDLFFDQLKEWGNTVWSLWKHNHGFTLEPDDLPSGLTNLEYAAGGPPVAGIVPYQMAAATWPANATDAVTIGQVSYLTDGRLIVEATSSTQPGAVLTASAVVGASSVDLGIVYWRDSLGYYRQVFESAAVGGSPTSITVTSSGGGSATWAVDPVTITRVSYLADGRLIVEAASLSQPAVTLIASAVVGGSSVDLGAVYWRDSLGYYRTVFPSGVVGGRPTSVTVTSSGGGSATSNADMVTIPRALYLADGRLVVEATSSAQPGATLTASAVIGGSSVDLGAVYWRDSLGYYRTVFSSGVVGGAPTSVTVTSSALGMNTIVP